MPAMPNFGGPVDYSAEPKTWPKTVGIISIVWGALGLICGGCSLLGSLGGSFVQQMAASNPQLAQQMQSMPPPSPLQIGTQALGMLVSVLLIVAGSMLISRKPVAAKLHLGWGVIAIVTTLAGALASIGPTKHQIQQSQAQMQASNPGGVPPGTMQGIEAMAYGMIGCFTLVFLAYPIFCVIWFGFVKRGTADITNAPEAPVA